MKKGIHPDNYRPVVFKDMSNEDVFITRSTINAKETIEIDGNDSTMKRRILFSVMCAVIAANTFAQGQGLAGINEATSLMTSYFDPATKLCYAIGAVLGLVGGIKTYGKFSSGDPDTSKTAASWFFACIFLIVAATILRSFFL